LNSNEELAVAKTAKRRADAGLASAVANVQVAEADVKLSQTNIDKAVIVAPIDGMVLDLKADLGQTVSASTTTVVLFTLAHDLGQMELQIDVDEADIGKVQVGNSAAFSVDAYLGQSFPASVSEMHFAPQTVDGIVTYPTILTIDNSDLRLRPGMLMVVELIKDERQSLMVPEAALDPANDKQFVVIVGGDNVARRVEVKIGRRRIGFVEILDGVKEGDLVVREGLQDLRNGAKVEIMNRSELTQPAHASRIVEPT
jgi:RND family efflux transporter MFP subunit